MKGSGELQIEDGGKQAEGFESPQAALKDEARGSEENPKGSPKTFVPALPDPAPAQEPSATQEKPKDLRRKLKKDLR